MEKFITGQNESEESTQNTTVTKTESTQNTTVTKSAAHANYTGVCKIIAH
jgi:hypothetical protein